MGKSQGLSEHSFKIKLDGQNIFSTYNSFKKGEMNDAFKSLEYFTEKEEGSKNVWREGDGFYKTSSLQKRLYNRETIPIIRI